MSLPCLNNKVILSFWHQKCGNVSGAAERERLGGGGAGAHISPNFSHSVVFGLIKNLVI